MSADWRNANVIAGWLESQSWDNIDELAALVADWIAAEGVPRTHGDDLCCLVCGAHISEPHDPECVFGNGA